MRENVWAGQNSARRNRTAAGAAERRLTARRRSLTWRAVATETFVHEGQAGRLLGRRGFLLDAPRFGELRAWHDGAVVADPAKGTIVAVGDYPEVARQVEGQAVRWQGGAEWVICPGLVDVHAHLPQYPASGCGQGELLPWLREHIFPLEREFTLERSQRESPRFFAELARHGTTTACLYTTVYEDSCDAAFRAAEASGLRVTLGKVMMDVGSYGGLAPETILELSLAQSERLCERWHGAGGGLLGYAFSPRFAVSCSEAMMRRAGELARRHGAFVQTHLAENFGEIARVRELFPDARDYTDVYDRCGLLGPKTVLGHCLHLSDREVATLAERGAAVAHCPTANFFLNSGLLPLARLRAAGVRVGLGSDVGAGPEVNLWQVMRAAVDTQKARSYHEPGVELLTAAGAFHLATQGGAEVLGLGEVVGSLDVGKEADLLVLDRAALSPYGEVAELKPEELVTLGVYRGGPLATVAAYVRGRQVYERTRNELLTPSQA